MKYSFERSFGNLSRTISKALGQRLECKLRKQNLSITAEQWSVISMLNHHGALSQKAIGLFIGFNKVRINRLIDHLEKTKIVKRSVGDSDRRLKIVALTKLGNQYYQQISPFAEETLKDATRGLNPEEVDLSINYLLKISNNLENLTKS